MKRISLTYLLSLLISLLVISGCSNKNADFLGTATIPRTVASPTESFTLTPRPTFTETPTALPSATPTPTPTSTPTPTATPLGGSSGRIVFRVQEKYAQALFPDISGDWNIFSGKLDGSDIVPLTRGFTGINFALDISPDGKNLIFLGNVKKAAVFSNRGGEYIGDLYIVNIDHPSPKKIVANVYQSINYSAYWFADGTQIAYIARNNGKNAIFIINPDGTDPVQITKADTEPRSLLPSQDPDVIYWDDSHYIVHTTTLTTGDETIAFGGFDGYFPRSRFFTNKWIFLCKDSDKKCFLAASDIELPVNLPYSNCDPCMFISPDGSKAIVKTYKDAKPGNSGNPTGYLWSRSTLSAIQLPASIDLSTHLPDYAFVAIWSPDSRLVLLTGNFSPYIFDVERMEAVYTFPDIPVFDRLEGWPIFWLP